MIGILPLCIPYSWQCEIVRNTILQIRDFVDDVVLIDFKTKDYRNSGYIDNIDIVKFNINANRSWQELVSDIDEFLQEYEFETIFLLNTSMPGASVYDISKILDYENNFKGTKNGGPPSLLTSYYFRFIFFRIVFVDRIADNGINVIHFVLNPSEIDWSDYLNFKSYRRYSFLKDGDYNYAPMYERSLFLENKIDDYRKRRSFVFRGTCFRYIGNSDSRYFLRDMEKRLQKKGLDFKVCYKRKRDCMSQYTYYIRLRASKYTLIVRNLQDGYFSMIRFFEAISSRCIPLILDDVDTTMFEDTFPDIFQIVVDNKMIIKERQLLYRIKNYKRDLHIIDDIKATKSFKKITDFDSVEKFYNKLMEAIK